MLPTEFYAVVNRDDEVQWCRIGPTEADAWDGFMRADLPHTGQSDPIYFMRHFMRQGYTVKKFRMVPVAESAGNLRGGFPESDGG
jgi:hypothetical protein